MDEDGFWNFRSKQIHVLGQGTYAIVILAVTVRVSKRWQYLKFWGKLRSYTTWKYGKEFVDNVFLGLNAVTIGFG
jgi:hypothetical protein